MDVTASTAVAVVLSFPLAAMLGMVLMHGVERRIAAHPGPPGDSGPPRSVHADRAGAGRAPGRTDTADPTRPPADPTRPPAASAGPPVQLGHADTPAEDAPACTPTR